MMWINEVFLGFLGFASGMAVSAGVFSFIISANNNIKRIQLIIERICAALGNDTPYGKAFPSVQSQIGRAHV